MTAVPTSISKHQNLLVGGLGITYGLLYLGRVNVSVVLPILARDLDVSLAEVGALGTVFFWFYSIFQLVSGEVGSHVSPFRLISLGLLATALINLAFSFQSALIVMLILWGCNGIAQSAGWSPMMRILAERLDPARLKLASTLMPFGYVAGTALTWTLIGALAAGGDWRIGFWLPGLLLLLLLALWRRAGIDAPKAKSSGIRPLAILHEARGLAPVMLTAGLAGYVRNGALIWLPTYILDTGLIADNLVGAVAALTQVIVIPGLLLARAGVARSDKVFLTTGLMLAAAALSFLLLSLATGPLALLLVACGLMLLNGAFGLAVTSIPLLLAREGRASSTAGAVNMMATFFGGLAGFTIGALVDASGWSAVFVVWSAALLLASLVVWRSRGAEARWDGALASEPTSS